MANQNESDPGNSNSLSANDLEKRTIEQTMEILPGGARRLAAQLRTKLHFEPLWKALTNYNKLSEFIPNLTSSKVVSRSGNVVQLKQVGSQDFFGFMFSAEVLLELTEDISHGILKFHLLKGDFRRFDGSWSINQSDNENGSSLVYELTVQGFFGMPVSLIEERLRKDLTRNLVAVEKAAVEISNAMHC